jgi:hypothetical protein
MEVSTQIKLFFGNAEIFAQKAFKNSFFERK